MDASTLIWGAIFGSIELGFFVYGKKQKAVIPLLCGIGLMTALFYSKPIHPGSLRRYFDGTAVFYQNLMDMHSILNISSEGWTQ